MEPMARRCFLWLLVLCIFNLNEVWAVTAGMTASLSNLRSQMHSTLQEESMAQLKEKIMLNMTVERAVGLLASRTPALVALVQDSLGHHARVRREGADLKGRHLRQTITRHRSRGHKRVVRTRDLSGALGMLNHMAEVATQKKDLECVKCSEYDRKQNALLEIVRQELTLSNSQGAAARGALLRAEQYISLFQTKLPTLRQMLEDHKRKTLLELNTIEGQIGTLGEDINKMMQILEMAACEGAADPTSVTLLQCSHRVTGRSFITVGHSVIRQKLGELKSLEGRRLLRAGLEEEVDDKPLSNYADDNEGPACLHGDCELGGSLRSPFPGKRRQRKAACVSRSAPSCERMQDRFLQIQTGIEDKRDELRNRYDTFSQNADKVTKNYEAEIANLDNRLREEQTNLATATKQEDEAEELGRLKQIQYNQMYKEYQDTLKKCSSNVDSIITEICGLTKIRNEILSPVDQVLDCEVTGWTHNACSATCGGGTQELYRRIIMHPHNGAQCPPLQMVRVCNDQPCPTDCKLGDWSGWSSCTADCGGGVKQRVREVSQQPRHGGEPCGQTSESVACNVGSCDKDCILHEWNEWSSCSKVCGGGLRQRTRRVKESAVGEGTCPDPKGPERLLYRSCHHQECMPPPGAETVMCKSMLDVVLVLDGSGSLGEEGWADVKTLAKGLVSAMDVGSDTQVQVAVEVFSGPKDLAAFCKCTGNTVGLCMNHAGPPDVAEDCNVQFPAHLSSDLGSVSAAIDAAVWPAGGTMTSMALAHAEAELRRGRREAQSVVVVITDGSPMSPYKTAQASARLRKSARLMWVPVTRFAPLGKIKTWASTPLVENVLEVRDFASLGTISNVDRIISSMCPELETA